MKVVVQSAGAVASRARLGPHELLFDQPRSVPAGQDRGPSPLDAMVVAIGACAHYFAAAYLHGRGLPVERLTVEVEADKERAPVSRLGRLSMKVRVPAGLDARQIAGLERAIKSCPACGTLLHPPTVQITLESELAAGEARSA